jgi:hypothetical protein
MIDIMIDILISSGHWTNVWILRKRVCTPSIVYIGWKRK